MLFYSLYFTCFAFFYVSFAPLSSTLAVPHAFASSCPSRHSLWTRQRLDFDSIKSCFPEFFLRIALRLNYFPTFPSSTPPPFEAWHCVEHPIEGAIDAAPFFYAALLWARHYQLTCWFGCLLIHLLAQPRGLISFLVHYRHNHLSWCVVYRRRASLMVGDGIRSLTLMFLKSSLLFS